MNPNILEAIHELIAACGAQSFAQIYHEVKTQCPNTGGLEDVYPKVKEHVNHLVSIKSIVEHKDEFGIVYGYCSDF